MPGARLAALAGAPAYLAASLARNAWPGHPLAILAVTLAAAAAAVGSQVALAPAWWLGPDGRWLLERLVRFARERLARARKPAPVPDRTRAASGTLLLP